MTIIIAVLMWIVSSFGLVPDSHTIKSRVWGNYGPIEINNVESFARFQTGIVPVYQGDTCAVYLTLIDFNSDDTPIIMLERDCQAVEHSVLITYELSPSGVYQTEF